MDEHSYFFLGNCQTQYLSSMLGAVSSAERYFLGHRYGVNLALDGPLVPCVDKAEFFAAAAAAKKAGRRTILVLQETSRSRFAKRMERKKKQFSDTVLIPHVGFKSQWPEPGKDGQPLSESKIRRMWEWEKHEFLGKLERSGMQDHRAFADVFWHRATTQLRFYHPGHPNGSLFAEILEQMRPNLIDVMPFLDDLAAALRRSEGIYQNSNHTVEPRVVAALGLEWGRTDFYRAWQGLAESGSADGVQDAVARAREVIGDPERLSVVTWPFQAHFRSALGQACVRLGDREAGIGYLQQAAVELKGHGPTVRRTLTQAVRAGRPDAIESVLVGVAPHLVVFEEEHPGFRGCFQAVLGMSEGRQTLTRVQDQTDPQSWVHRYIGRMMAAA